MEKKKTYRILVTAGPTVEAIDPVRYISNFSTGIMGYSIAAEALRRGHRVCLVTGPVRLLPPKGADIVKVMTAEEMRRAINKKLAGTDCLVMAAAVCDFKPAHLRPHKIKKTGKKMFLELKKNPDILTGISGKNGLVKIGFALETENLAGNAEKKLKEKRLDMIVANRRSKKKDPFGEGEKDFIFIGRDKKRKYLKNSTKTKCASVILRKIERFLDEGNDQG
jgi:phosphopantothenoylcysteine decarboxylase/phosphopantothenate--cysteine ligase